MLVLTLLACNQDDLPGTPSDDTGAPDTDTDAPDTDTGDTDTDTDVDTDTDTDTDVDTTIYDTWCHSLTVEAIPGGDYELLLVKVQMSKGVWSEVARVPWFSWHEVSLGRTKGLASDGAVWVFPAGLGHHESDWFVLDPSASTVTALGSKWTAGESIGFTDGAWMALDMHGYIFNFFSTIDALASGTPTWTLGGGYYGLSGLSAANGEIFGGDNGSDIAKILDSTTGSIKRAINLEGFDERWDAISGAGGKIHVLDSGDTIRSFNAFTGESLETIANPGTGRFGLWCTQ